MKHRVRIIIYLLLAVTFMTLIFCFSAQPADKSKELSGNLSEMLSLILSKLFPNVNGFERIDDGIRTFAHGFEYFCLGISYMLLFSELFLTKHGRYPALISSICGLVYACTDEIHQLFVPERAFQLSDIAVDLLGCAVGVLAAAFIVYLTDRRTNTIENSGALLNDNRSQSIQKQENKKGI